MCQFASVSLVRTVAAVHGNHLVDGLGALDRGASEVFKRILRENTANGQTNAIQSKMIRTKVLLFRGFNFERPPADSESVVACRLFPINRNVRLLGMFSSGRR